MVIKKRNNPSQENIEKLAYELADKPYGEKKKEDILMRTTITLPSSILFALEDMAKNNKRSKNDLRSVSALIRDSIEKTFNFK
jgi:hypothetical protein